MSEDEKEKDVKIIWVDGYPYIELPPNSIMKKGQRNSVNHPFTFGCMQEVKKREFMPDIFKDLDKLINTPFFPTSWKVYKITEKGEIKELKDEDEENDNAK